MARVKAKALSVQCQSMQEVQAFISKIGALQREHKRESTLMNDEIAQIVEQHKDKLHSLDVDIGEHIAAVQAWCESNRQDLTKGGKVKSCDLVTGRVSWRQRPPSVSLRKVDVVLEKLKTLGLTQFIRIKEEVNKEAVLADPDVAGAVTGITIKSGVEDFVVEPFEKQE